MGVIYSPKGKAREYSPLALNIYNGCDHDCSYCYIKNISNFLSSPEPTPKNDLIKKLTSDLKNKDINKQVLLSFSGDPYCKKDVEIGLTRKVLGTLLINKIPTAILTKGGNRCLRDLDLFDKFSLIKVGATLTLLNEKQRQFFEPGANSTMDRIKTLKKLHASYIKTWVSIEPVIDPEQSFEIIKQTYSFVDQFKIGKMNHNYEIESKINWKKFGIKVVEFLRKNNKSFYVKHDLAQKMIGFDFDKNEVDMDFLCLEKAPTEQLILF